MKMTMASKVVLTIFLALVLLVGWITVLDMRSW